MDDHDERARLKRLQDYADLQDENAGRDTGKIRRFTSESDTLEMRAERRQADDRFFLETLTYQQRVQRLRDRLAELDRQSLEALREAEDRLRESEETLERIRHSATIAPDGRRVYRSADGTTAIDDDGNELSAAEMAGIEWKPGAPTLEERIDSGRDHSEARRQVTVIQEQRTRLEQAQQRIDGGDQLSPDELAVLEADVQSMSAPGPMRNARPSSRASAARDHVRDDAFAGAPPATDAFNGAARGPQTNPSSNNPATPSLTNADPTASQPHQALTP